MASAENPAKWWEPVIILTGFLCLYYWILTRLPAPYQCDGMVATHSRKGDCDGIMRMKEKIHIVAARHGLDPDFMFMGILAFLIVTWPRFKFTKSACTIPSPPRAHIVRLRGI